MSLRVKALLYFLTPFAAFFCLIWVVSGFEVMLQVLAVIASVLVFAGFTVWCVVSGLELQKKAKREEEERRRDEERAKTREAKLSRTTLNYPKDFF